MQEIDSRPRISRHKGEADEYSFENLRRVGLGYIQELACDRWTDYNVHDPGVTILEEVCYAMTDILYRADFEVADFLVDEQGEIDWDRQGLLPPERVFPSRPVTNVDYQTAILDAVTEVENVRLEAIPQDDQTPGGLFRIRLRLKEEKAAKGDGQESRAREDAVARAVRQVFARSRNLCEDLDEIEIFPSVPYRPHAEVDIADREDPATVLARIYLACGKTLAAGIEFKALDCALAQGQQPEEVFRGPFASCGVVAADRGTPLASFPTSDLYSLIKKVEGVEAVKVLPTVIDMQGARDRG